MNPLLGIFLQVLAMFAFTLQGAFVRYLGDRIPLGEVVFARSFFALVPLLLIFWLRGELHHIRTKNLRGHVVRSFTNVSGMFLNYASLVRIPLADATAIGYAMPIFNVVLAAVFLGEKVRTWRWGAVIIGLIGVLVMLWPHLGQGPADDMAMAGALFALIAAFLFSIAMTQVRHLSATETTAALVFFYSVIAALISLVTLFWGWVIPSRGDFAMLFSIGVVGGLAQILMTESLRHAEAGVIAPFAYVSMIWATVIGWAWFGELPGIEVVLGALIVIGAGLMVIWRETKHRKKRAKNIMPPNIPAPPSS